MTFLDIHVMLHAARPCLDVPGSPRSPGIAGRHFTAIGMAEMASRSSRSACKNWNGFDRKYRSKTGQPVYVPKQALADLDPEAIGVARANFRAKNQTKPFADEIDSWSDEAFLDRAKLTVGGKISRTSLLLLGRSESTHFITPAVAQITWRLEGEEQAYEHFGPPFLLTTNDLYSRIRNTFRKSTCRISLCPWRSQNTRNGSLLEAMHNAIAHQDYVRSARIIVTETADRLRVESAGRFFEGQVSDYTLAEKTPQRYRNRFLADAMVNVNMIDTMGYGIRRMFLEQRKRFYPLPDIDVADPDNVVVTIHGKVIDPSYTATLIEQTRPTVEHRDPA